jgi:pSer/pThr/pTyr-binding forkhead associated (FHA) protein
MQSPPVIVVQMVHIEGPMKGEIQEFSDPVILIGRHPDSHVCLPKDQTAVSRNHAEIVREGNRFRLVDKSTNGTFVNGKRIQEVYLKDGDVITFTENGPKISFLTKLLEGRFDAAHTTAKADTGEIPAVEPSPVFEVGKGLQIKTTPSSHPAMEPSGPVYPRVPPPRPPAQVPPSRPVNDIALQKVQVPFVVQYGPTLKSVKELPVYMGKNQSCELIIQHPAIIDRHAQIFFYQDRYWIRDLTGQNFVSVNGRPIHNQAPLNPEDAVALSPQGPTFRFLGGGRLAEIEELHPEQKTPSLLEKHIKTSDEKSNGKGLKGAKAIFDKFLRR